MLYRTMRKSGEKLSILGYGCMRLPVKKDGKVDVPEAVKEIRYGIDHGINYVDTAWPYHNGESEIVTGKALQDGYREKVNLATKLPTWLITSRKDMDKYLDEQLKKLQTDHIDFYLMHNLEKGLWEIAQKHGYADFLDDALADGRIRYAGFSFHDKVDLFKEVVDAYDWTFCQIQYNYLDEEYQAGTEGLKFAAAKGLDIIAMEPLRGGSLTRPVPDIDKLWTSTGKSWTPAEWGLRWVWNHPDIAVTLSGMSTMEQVKENLKIADKGIAGSLSDGDLKLIGRIRDTYRERMKVDCTGCGYCMPCPNQVSIPDCFRLYNNAYMFGDPEAAKSIYNMFLSEGCASKCVECGECEEKCPQHLPIGETLKEVAKLFGK